MKKSVLFVVLAFNFALAYCARAPKWVDDVEAEYPRETYIARLGSGTTAENAQASAVGQIASFFKSEVVVNTNATQNLRNDGAKTEKRQEIDQRVQVVSDMSLTAVEYNTPYYDKRKKTWFVVAYIERVQGFQAVSAQVHSLRARYDSFLELARKTEESLLRYKYLVKARETGEELLSALNMGFLFDSSKKGDYKDFVSELNGNEELGTLDSFRVPVFVESRGDYENTITSKIVEALKSCGLSPSYDRKKSGDAILSIQIDSNEKSSDEICTVYPEVSVTLLSAGGEKTFYSWQHSWGKTAAFSLSGAQKKAFPKIAEEVKSSLPADFVEKFLMK